MSGHLGSIGLLAGLCAEVVTPAGALNGSVACVEHEIVVTAGYTAGSHIGYSNVLTFMQFALSGDTTGDDYVDDYGQFMTIYGLEAADTHMLSEGYATLKISVNNFAKYLVLSRIENGLGLGGVGSQLNLDVNSPLFQLYTTSTSVAATTYSAIIQQTMTTAGTGGYSEVLRVQLIGNVNMGASHNAIFAQINYSEDGYAHGEGSVITAEIDFPSGTSPVRGEYNFFKAEINVPTACELNLTRVAIIGGNVWGGNETDFDDHGLLLNIDGVTSTASGFYYLANLEDVHADGLLKVRIDDIDYYMFITTTIDGT